LGKLISYYGINFDFIKNIFENYSNSNDLSWLSSNYYNFINCSMYENQYLDQYNHQHIQNELENYTVEPTDKDEPTDKVV
jgi:hypothetical protein